MPDRLAPLYLTDADVDALAPSLGAMANAIAAAFLARARGTAVAPAKTALNCPGSDLHCQASLEPQRWLRTGEAGLAGKLEPGRPGAEANVCQL